MHTWPQIKSFGEFQKLLSQRNLDAVKDAFMTNILAIITDVGIIILFFQVILIDGIITFMIFV